MTGGWGQPIAEELLITKCQWSREAELNGRLWGRLGYTVPGLRVHPWAPPAELDGCRSLPSS